MAVTLDTYAGGISASGNSYTRSYTCSGSDRMLFTGTSLYSNVVTAVTYAGVSMTHQSSNGNHRIFDLVNPASGANNIVYTHAAYLVNFYSIASFAGVDQTTPTGAYVTSNGTTSPISTGSITCPTDGMIYGSAFGNYGGSAFTINSGTLLDTNRSAGGGQLKAGGYRSSTGSIAWNGGGGYGLSCFGVDINPVAAAASLRPVPLTVLDAVNRASSW